MAKILLLYSTTDGHTIEICRRLQKVMEQNAHQVTLVAIKDHPEFDVAPFDKIVIGASIRYGKHNPLVSDFIKKNERLLDAKPNAFFSVNVVARKPDKNQPGTNPYLQKFLKKITWKPKVLAVFAGKIDYPRYDFFDRTMIRFIMWITKGPTDPKGTYEFTDWHQVEEFGQRLSQM